MNHEIAETARQSRRQMNDEPWRNTAMATTLHIVQPNAAAAPTCGENLEQSANGAKS